MADAQNPSIFRIPSIGIAAGVVIGTAIVVILTLSGFGQSHDEEAPIATPQAALNFAEAYEKSLDAEYLQVTSFVRTQTNGDRSESQSISAQMPPNLVRIAGGNITTVRNGEITVCTQAAAGAQATCQAPTPYDPAETNESQSEVVSNLVSDENGLYSVVEEDGCFDLNFSPAQPGARAESLPWGTKAHMCFDEQTGVLRSGRYERDGRVDEVTTSYLRANVSNEDLDRLSRGDTSGIPGL